MFDGMYRLCMMILASELLQKRGRRIISSDDHYGTAFSYFQSYKVSTAGSSNVCPRAPKSLPCSSVILMKPGETTTRVFAPFRSLSAGAVQRYAKLLGCEKMRIPVSAAAFMMLMRCWRRLSTLGSPIAQGVQAAQNTSAAAAMFESRCVR